MDRDIIVSASLLAADFTALGEQVTCIEKAGADWIHFDVMDGIFVPSISFGEPLLRSVSGIAHKPVDVHLMISDPIRYIDRYAADGVEIITVHHESAGDILPSLKKIRELGLKAGISVKPATDVSVITPYIDYVDLILIMTVEPGFGGQVFLSETLEKIRQARSLADSQGRDIIVEVDGGINDKTAALVRECGADALVSGSYIFSARDRESAIEALRGRADVLQRRR